MADPPSKHEMPADVQELLMQQASLVDAGLFSEADEQGLVLMEQIAVHAIQLYENDPDFQEQMLGHACETAGAWGEARRILESRLSRVDRNDLLELSSRYRELARLHLTLDELNLAAMYSAEAIECARRFAVDDVLLRHWLPFDATIALGQRRYQSARECYDEALAYLSDDRMHDLERANNLIGRAKSQLRVENHHAAQADHQEAWERLAPWSAMESAGGVQNSFSSWWSLEAEFWELEGEWEQATHAWHTALEYRRRSVELWDEGCPQSLLPLAGLLTGFGDYLTRRSEWTDAESLYAESDQIRRKFKLATLPRESR